MEENNKNQMANCESELKLIRQICETNNKLAEENKRETKKMLDDHCKRIRFSEKEITVMKTETKPIVNFFNKISQFMIGLCILIGGVIVGGLYFLKDKITN